jgi:outer membrane lipoprotein carrier protein
MLGKMAMTVALLMLLLVLSSQSFAATDKEPKAELKVLLGALQSYQADFTQTIEDWTGEVLQQSEGKLTLQKPNQLRWQVSQPDESLFIADGAVVYNIDPFVEQVSLLDQSQIIDNNPLMLLISDDPAAWNEVNISYSEGSFIINATNPDANITELALTFTDDILSALVSKDKQRQTNRIVFTNAQQNIKVADNSFTAIYPESYVIDDQRSAENF